MVSSFESMTIACSVSAPQRSLAKFKIGNLEEDVKWSFCQIDISGVSSTVFVSPIGVGCSHIEVIGE